MYWDRPYEKMARTSGIVNTSWLCRRYELASSLRLSELSERMGFSRCLRERGNDFTGPQKFEFKLIESTPTYVSSMLTPKSIRFYSCHDCFTPGSLSSFSRDDKSKITDYLKPYRCDINDPACLGGNIPFNRPFKRCSWEFGINESCVI